MLDLAPSSASLLDLVYLVRRGESLLVVGYHLRPLAHILGERTVHNIFLILPLLQLLLVLHINLLALIEDLLRLIKHCLVFYLLRTNEGHVGITVLLRLILGD